MKAKHERLFEEFTSTFPAATVEEWKRDVEQWEADPKSEPNPFQNARTGTNIFSQSSAPH